MSKKIVCPSRKCKSVNVVPLDSKQKPSLLGAAVGGVVSGPVGAVLGAASGSGKKKITFRCLDCGTVLSASVEMVLDDNLLIRSVLNKYR